MENNSRIYRLVEVYKCVLLTVIAIILLLIFMRTPVPFTLKNMQQNKVEVMDMPVVKVR